MLVVSAPKRRRKPLDERFWSKVDKNGPVPEHRPDLGPCWLWTASIDHAGYGRFSLGVKNDEYAHRVGYWLETGGAADELDHLCRVRRCCRPLHLEEVTHRVNVLRGNGWAGRAHRGELTNAMRVRRAPGHTEACKRGHPRTGKNVHVDKSGGWKCRPCERERWHRRKALQTRG